MAVNLLKLGVFVEGCLESLEDQRVGVDVARVVIHGALIEVCQDHVTNLAVIPLQVSITPALPESLRVLIQH